MAPIAQHALLLAAEALFVGLATLLLFHLRRSFGLLPLAIFVGGYQYLQSLLSANYYLSFSQGFVASPGSAILLPATIVALLLIYLQDGVTKARSLIWGICICNVTLAFLILVTSMQIGQEGGKDLSGLPARLLWLDAKVFLLTSAVLLIELLLVLVVYEFLSSRLSWLPLVARLPMVFVLVLAIDTLAYVGSTLWGSQDLWPSLLSQWVAKSLGGTFFGLLLFAYLHWIDRDGTQRANSVGTGVFSIFTYRRRYDRLRQQKKAQEAAFESERAESRLEIRALESRYRTLFKTISDGMLLVDEKTGQIIDLNPALIQMSGRGGEGLIGKTLQECGLSEDGLLEGRMPAGLGYNLAPPIETRLHQPSGKALEVEIRATHFQQDGKRILALVVRNITARKLTEQTLQEAHHQLEQSVIARTEELATKNLKLQESESRYRDLFDNSHDLIQAVAPDGSILLVNNAWKKALGYTEEEIQRLNVFDVIHPNSQAHCQSSLGRLMGGEEIGLLEAEFLTKDGGSLLLEGQVNCYFEQGRPVSTRAIFRDVTERRAVVRMKERFIATVSHELRTPLTSIYGSLKLLSDSPEGSLPEKARRFIDVAHRNAKRLTWLINEILEFQKIGSGLVELNLRRQDLSHLVRQSVEENMGFADQFGISIEVFDDGPLVVTTDRRWLQQVFSNLLSNAVKFSPRGGQVTVQTRRAGARVRVSVQDRGPGIPIDFRDQIFQPFSQAQKGPRPKVAGTGLGLSIAKAIIEQMHGKIDFVSQEGAGATFFFELPADPPGSDEVGESKDTPTGEQNGQNTSPG